MNPTTVTIAADVPCQLAENPLWDAPKQCVYWTDIPAGKLYSLDVTTGRHRMIYEGEPVGGFTLQENGDLLLFRQNDISLLNGQGIVSKLRAFTDNGMKRFNDVIADPRGRVFAGTIGEHPKGGLYRVDLDGAVTKLFSGTGCSNGMGFSPDAKKFYWTCSTTRHIFQFDFDAESGAITNRSVFYATTPDEGIPDGLTVDVEGCVWSARWAGASVVRHAPDGSVLTRLRLPAENITSLCFGGTSLEDVFVTSAQSEEANPTPVPGLFRMGVGIRGVPEFRSRINLPATSAS
ncbi:MAG: SMP-30/Gluconolaconase/LRE domain protein [Verrucomicrobiales bacterium]|nr:SMP-30/Gluconolaconase/LRE domain protein [Verrucomicrobiales bacterium]